MLTIFMQRQTPYFSEDEQIFLYEWSLNTNMPMHIFVVYSL